MDLELLCYLFSSTSFIKDPKKMSFSVVSVSGAVESNYLSEKESVSMKALSYISLALYKRRVNTQFMWFRVL
jgi:hypothetical protein